MSKNQWSLLALIGILIFIFTVRLTHVHDKELSWDILGYYTYLPATFIHHDPLLTDISWLESTAKELDLAGTLYFIGYNYKGSAMYFFLMGMALLYLPWFFLGHLIALIFDFPADGFSAPYIYSMIIGALTYTSIGVWYFRKILLNYFSDYLVALLLVIAYIGTNAVHHLIAKNLETVNFLFMLAALVVWFTIKWHNNQKLRYLLAIGAGIALMTLIKPSEILIGVFPVIYGVWNKQSFSDKVALIKVNYKQFIITIALGLLLFAPQMIYWYKLTGSFIYDSYNNPGVGLDWTSPYIGEILFSFRKGWLIYTPVMVLSLLGFRSMFKENKKLFWASVIYFLLAFYLISSWTEWWYGSSYSLRPIITLYPVLLLSMGYFLKAIFNRGLWLKLSVACFIGFTIFLNQFQWWQFRNYILDDQLMSETYYKKVFLKPYLPLGAREYLAYSEPEIITEEHLLKFNKTEFVNTDKKIPEFWKDTYDISNTDLLEVTGKEDNIYLIFYELPLEEVTDSRHYIIEVKLDYKLKPMEHNTLPPLLTCFIKHKGQAYKFDVVELDENSDSVTFRSHSPLVRSAKDKIGFQIWNRSNSDISVHRVKADVYSLKPEFDY